MKTIITSVFLVAALINTAAAQNKVQGKVTGSCPAATCTDHSYDQAYTAPQNHNTVYRSTIAKSHKSVVKDCPAATCTDHSYDVAYSANHPMPAAQNSTVEVLPTLPRNTWVSMNGNERVYSMQEFTYYGRGVMGVNRPSAYEGDDAPTYDGFEKNKYRNMRANNDSEPLPANNGW